MGVLFCKSGVRNYLSPYGYGTLPLPKAEVRPLTLLGKRGGKLAPLGPMAATFRPGAKALPEASRGRTANLSGSKSSSLDISLGLDLLGQVIGALSGSTLGLSAAYKDAAKVEFEFGDVMETTIDINALDEYLAATVLDSAAGPFIRQQLDKDDVYAITSTVDARQINVKASSSGGTELKLDIPVIQQVVGGKIAVGSAGSSSSVVSYTATDAPLVIGIQVVKLYYDGEKYKTLKLVKSDDTKPASLDGRELEEGDLSFGFPEGELLL